MRPGQRRQRALRNTLLACGLFFLALTALAWQQPLLPWLLGSYLSLSLLTLVYYAWDKRSARLNRQRTPENTLHLLALLGGWPGAMLAQQWLRHKSSKVPFRRVFWLTVAINLIALLWLLFPANATQLIQLL